MQQGEILIKTHILDLEVVELSNHKDFFDYWVDSFKTKILAELEKTIAPYSVKNQLIKVDKLKIEFEYTNDVPRIEDLIPCVAKQLKAQLSKRTNRSKTTLSDLNYQLEVFKTYLISGHLPTWWNSDKSKTIASLYQKIKQIAPKELNQIVIQLANLKNAQKRLTQLDPSIRFFRNSINRPLKDIELLSYLTKNNLPITVKKIIWEKYLRQLLEASQRKRLQAFFSDEDIYQIFSIADLNLLWIQLLKKEQIQLKSYLVDLQKLNAASTFLSNNNLTKSFYISGIKYKLLTKNERFNPEKLLKLLAGEFAFLRNESINETTKIFSKYFEQYTIKINFESPIFDLWKQYFPRDHKQSSFNKKNLSKLPAAIHFLLYGNINEPLKTHFKLEIELIRLLEKSPYQLKRYFHLLSNNPIAINRLVQGVSLSLLDKILFALVDHKITFIPTLLEDLVTLASLQFFPINTLESYEKEVRKQVLLLFPELPKTYSLTIKKILIQLCYYYDISYRIFIEACLSKETTPTFSKVLTQLQLEKSDDEIQKILTNTEQQYKIIFPTRKQRHGQYVESLLSYYNIHRKRPWWVIKNKNNIEVVTNYLTQFPETITNKLNQLDITHQQIILEQPQLLFSPNSKNLPLTKEENNKNTPINSPSKSTINNSNLQEQLLHLNFYFSRAYLPKSWSSFTKVEIQKIILSLIKNEPVLFSTFIRNGLWQKQFNPLSFSNLTSSVLVDVFSNLYRKPKVILKNYWQDIEQLLSITSSPLSKIQIKKHLKKALIKHLFNEQKNTVDNSLFILYLLEEIAEFLQVPKKKWLKNLYENLVANQISFRSDLPKLLAKELKINTSNQDSFIQKLKKIIPIMHKEESVIYVHNSGLLLLSSWLPRYFQMLDLLDENKQFKSRKAQERAVHLVEYLATGRVDTEEHLLSFNKILCGISVVDPVPLDIEMSEQEIDISNQMLKAVISNWSSIGNTSIEGLRGNFIVRDGKIEEKTDHWEITVEQKSYDILLDSLPWSINMVKLPWVEKRLQSIWR